jgi:hypothetical protein
MGSCSSEAAAEVDAGHLRVSNDAASDATELARTRAPAPQRGMLVRHAGGVGGGAGGRGDRAALSPSSPSPTSLDRKASIPAGNVGVESVAGTASAALLRGRAPLLCSAGTGGVAALEVVGNREERLRAAPCAALPYAIAQCLAPHTPATEINKQKTNESSMNIGTGSKLITRTELRAA